MSKQEFVKDFFFILLIVIIAIVPLVDLFHPGLPITHDGQDHVARIANFYRNLSDGVFVPRWAPNLNWGFGHPILMFLYPLPSYLTSLFHFFGFSLIDSTKIVFLLGFIASGLTMYLWVASFLGQKEALVSGFLYMFAPYRFVDLYVRGAIGEHVAFVFPPVLFYFLYKLKKRNSYWYIFGAALSFYGLLLSHNAMSLMFLPLIIFYIAYLFWQTKEKKIFLIQSILIIFLGFGLTAFFLIPAFFEGKYTLREIVTAGAYSDNFVGFKEFFYSQWNYGGTTTLSKQIGILQWIFVLFSLPAAFLYKKKRHLYILGFGALGIFFLSLFLMTSYSNPIWKIVPLLQKFQFPWRFLSISVFTAAILGGLVFSALPRKTYTVVIIFVLFLLFLFNKDYWHANGYLLKSDSFFTGIYDGTTDTGESAPIWSVRFMEKEPQRHIELIKGDAKITEIKRTSIEHVYTIKSLEQIQLKENTLYFPGWTVFVDGKRVPIEFQDASNRGLITFFVDKGEHVLVIIFQDTRLRVISNRITIISFLFLGLFYLAERKKIWKIFR